MQGGDDQTQENHTLYLFLANQNAITQGLKEALKDIEKYFLFVYCRSFANSSEDVIGACINFCANRIDESQYLVPNEKHMLIRVIPFALFLIDSDDAKKDAFHYKFLNPNQLKAVFKVPILFFFPFTTQRWPVVPVYGDMQVQLDTFVKKAPHFDASWFTYDAKIQMEYA